MSISLDEVRHVAKLARLELDEAEMMSLQGELNKLLGHCTDIQSVDMSGVDAVSHAVNLKNVWADDRPGEVLSRDAALSNAPQSKAGLFVVPIIIED